MTDTEQDRWGDDEEVADLCSRLDAIVTEEDKFHPVGCSSWWEEARVAVDMAKDFIRRAAQSATEQVGIANGDAPKNNPMGAELLAALKEALANLDALDDYMKQPERGEWGVECAVCMNEWLEPHDRAAMERARALITRAEASTGEGEPWDAARECCSDTATQQAFVMGWRSALSSPSKERVEP
jgi:hypothetical protein